MQEDMGKEMGEFVESITSALRKAAEEGNRYCFNCGTHTQRIANGYESRTGKRKFILRCPHYVWWKLWDRHSNVKLPF